MTREVWYVGFWQVRTDAKGIGDIGECDRCVEKDWVWDELGIARFVCESCGTHYWGKEKSNVRLEDLDDEYRAQEEDDQEGSVQEDEEHDAGEP